MKNKKFIYALLVFWLLQGVYFTLTTLMEPILQYFDNGSLDSMFIGTLGTILTVTAVIATLVLPAVSDRSKSKKRKPIVLICEVGALVGLALIVVGHSVGLQILMACCLGIFLTGVTPHCDGVGLRVRLSGFGGRDRKPDAAGGQWLGSDLPFGGEWHL